MSQPRVHISTVTPVYCGADYLRDLVAAFASVRETLAGGPIQISEVILVADDPVDRSGEVIDELCAAHDWVRSITLSRNFGQHPATIAGILHTSGDWVATLDEDLQHRPERLIEMLRVAVEHAADTVYAHPAHLVHDSGFRDGSSRLIKWLLSKLAGNPVIPRFNSFRLMRGPLARAAAGVCGHETFFDVALTWFTTRTRSLTFEMKDLRYKKAKASGYNLHRLLSHARRLIVSSQANFLRYGALFGLCAVLVSVLGGLWLLAGVWFDPAASEVRGWASLMLAILMFGGATMLVLGFVSEYLSSVVLHTQGKPVFFVVDRSQDALVQRWLSERGSGR